MLKIWEYPNCPWTEWLKNGGIFIQMRFYSALGRKKLLIHALTGMNQNHYADQKGLYCMGPFSWMSKLGKPARVK